MTAGDPGIRVQPWVRYVIGLDATANASSPQRSVEPKNCLLFPHLPTPRAVEPAGAEAGAEVGTAATAGKEILMTIACLACRVIPAISVEP